MYASTPLHPFGSWTLRQNAGQGTPSTADLVMFDLEDSVALAEKEAARQQVITTLKGLPEHHPRLALRCNGLETTWFYRDVIEILEAAVDQVSVLVIPKLKTQAMWLVSAAYWMESNDTPKLSRLFACMPASKAPQAWYSPK